MQERGGNSQTGGGQTVSPFSDGCQSEQEEARMTPVRPSETQDYIRCPRYWYWKHVEGWEPPASAWTPDRLMGSAVHAGLSSWWWWRKDSSRTNSHDQVVQAKSAVSNTFDVLWPPDAPMEFSREGLESQALKVLDAVLRWIAREMPDAEPLMVEQALGDDGHTTPDLVTRESFPGTHSEECYGSSTMLGRQPGICDSRCGTGLVITDWKTSWNVPADRVQYRLQGAYREHQFLHYCWAVGQHLGEPVRLFRKVVIVGSPKIIIRDVTFTPSPEAIEYWLTGARVMWSDMAKIRSGERVPSQNVNGCKMYGDKYPCPMYEGCWTCHGDQAKMTQFLTRSPR